MARVLVPLADGCEEIEAVTIIDILRRAGIDVVTAGLAAGAVTASRGVVLVPDATLQSIVHESFDMIVLPGGGAGVDRLRRDERLLSCLRSHLGQGRPLAAICAAPRVLADAGLLAGRRVTSFPGWLDGVRDIDYRETAVVVDGDVITSRGPGTAMDFALELVVRLAGADKAAEVEAGLQRPAQAGGGATAASSR